MKAVRVLKITFLVVLSLAISIVSFYPAQEAIMSVVDNRYIADASDVTYFLMEGEKGFVLDLKWEGRREHFTSADLIIVRHQPTQVVDNHPEKYTAGQQRVIYYLNNPKGTAFEYTPVAEKSNGLVDTYFFSTEEYIRLNIDVYPLEPKPQFYFVHLVDTRLNGPRGWVKQLSL